MLSLGCILISNLVNADLFMHSLLGMHEEISNNSSYLPGRALFYTKGILHEMQHTIKLILAASKTVIAMINYLLSFVVHCTLRATKL